MRLKKLRIHNIASISDATIDFDGPELSEEPLFLICGETGSGKTTILDAICLALYNETPRLSQAVKESYTDTNGTDITLSNPVQYLRKGTGEGFIHLTFESADKIYLAEWSIARAYKKADGKFQKIEWTVEDTETSAVSKGNAIKDIIGLGFEEFRRTVMLAQGDFTAFLKSKNEEKIRILEKITGTGIYKEIGKKIGEHYRKAQNDYEVKSKSIEVLESTMLGDDEVKILTSDIESCSAQIGLKNKMRPELERLKAAKEQEDEASADIERNKKALTAAESEFRRLSGGLAYATGVQQEKNVELEKICSYIGQNAPKDALYKDTKLIVKDLNDIDSNEKSISEKTIEVKDAEKKCAEIELLFKTVTDNIARKEREYAVYKECLDNLSAEKERMDEQKLKSLKALLEKLGTLKNLSDKLSEQIASNEKELERLNTGLKGKQASFQAALDVFNSNKAIYEKMKDANSQWAKDARAGLKVGDACPVCGQLIPSDEYLDSLSQEHFQSLLTPVKEELAKAEAEKDKRYKTVVETSAEIKALESVLLKQRNELKDNDSETVELERTKNSDGYPVLSLEEVNERLETVGHLTKQIEHQNNLLTQEASVLAGLKGELGKISAEKASYSAKIESLSRYIEETSGKNQLILERTDLKMEGNSWRSYWESDRENFVKGLQAAADTYLSALEKRERLEMTLNNIKETLDAMYSIRDGIIKDIPAFGELPAGNCELVKEQLGLWSELSSKIRSAVNGLKNAEEKYKKQSGIAKEALKVLTNNPDAIRIENCEIDKTDAKRILDEITAELSKLNEEIGYKRNQLIQNEKHKKQIEQDLTILKGLAATRDKWKELNDVFGRKDGEYFQKIAQSFVMNDILSRANHYLRTITKRYILESQANSLEILVRDMEQGGVTRTTSTISGGESFIISLALALGLSSLGAGSNIYVDTLFIDEGFGTLSSEYLDTVTETLQKLNESGGKRVGIISHVKELRERIGAKITVTKINATESTVTVTSL